MNDVILNPNYLAYKFDFDHETVEFLRINVEELHQLSFLRRSAFDPERESIVVPIADLVELVNSPNESIADNPPRFIFHTAFCASTFLSRCLDLRGVSISLREPQILLDAANAKRIKWESRSSNLNYTHLPKLALILLQKHALMENGAAKKLIIKPINSVNNIIPELIGASPSSKSLLMYTDARNFLLSTMRKGEAAKHTVRAMFDLIRCDFPHLANLSLSNAILMSDLKLTLTLWRLQLEQAQSALRSHAETRCIASLNAKSLTSDLSGELNKANQFLELGLSQNQILSILDSDNRNQDAKDPNKEFNVEKREANYLQIENFLGADLENGYRWMLKNNPSVSLTPRLDTPLS